MDLRQAARKIEMLPLLDRLPGGRAFSTAEALDSGVSPRQLRELAGAGMLRHPVRGVYHFAQLPDSLSLRIDCLKLVVPAACVVTDRTAAWLWGAPMVLNPGAHLEVPRVSVFSPPGHRLRNGLTASGERMLSPDDIDVVEGLRVTTPLRTACDLGRLLHRDQAFAAMDSLASLRAFSVDRLVCETSRFAGYRGVVQLRALAPFVDPASQSPGESILRLRWLDVGLPRPRCQVEVPSPGHGSYWIDLGLEDRKFGAEYDGEEFHTEDDEKHDTDRRDWLGQAQGWVLVVARKANIHGPHQDIDQLLIAAAFEAGLKRR